MGRIFRFLVLFIIVGGLTIFLAKNTIVENNSSSKLLSPVAKKPVTSASFPSHAEEPGEAAVVLSATASSRLKGVIQKELFGTTGSYAIVVKNLHTGEQYEMNENNVYKSASLYKLWVMAEVFDQVQKGLLSEDQVLTEDIPTLNDKFWISSDSAEQTEGSVTETVDDALNQMITVSDNYSALLLTENIRLASVASFLTDHGFNNSEVGLNGGEPTTTASDTALFFEKLYNGELANANNSDKMLTLLKNQQLNEKIPKYLPEGVVIAHKTGELDDVTHDAGIVYTPNGNYILVVLSESDDPQVATEKIAGISKAVYDYFTNS